MAFPTVFRRTLNRAVCIKCASGLFLDQNFLIKTGKSYATGPGPKYIIAEHVGCDNNMGLVRFNRPQSYHAFSTPMFNEIARTIADYDTDDKIRAIIVTGNEKVFSSGGDIKEAYKRTYPEVQKQGFLKEWENIAKCRKPIIAAVNGFALGGGFELALTCDITYASEAASFCLSEEVIGTVCQGGGTQRLVRSISKTRVMEMILSANIIDAYTAEMMGFISKVCPHNNLLEECIKLAEKISLHSPIAVQLAKEAVNQAFETTLLEGLKLEKHMLDNLQNLEKSEITSYLRSN